MLKELKMFKSVFEQNKALRKELVFYKAYSKTMEQKASFMEDTLREILHYKLENPKATTYELNQVGRKYVAKVKNQKTPVKQEVTNERQTSEKCLEFESKTIDYVSRFLMDEPSDMECYSYSEEELLEGSC